MSGLSQCTSIFLDGQPIQVSAQPISLKAELIEEGKGFRLRAVNDLSVQRRFKNGAVLQGNTLRAVKIPSLTLEERTVLQGDGKFFGQQDFATLFTQLLPSLQKKLIVEVKSQRLPQVVKVPPKIRLEMNRLGAERLCEWYRRFGLGTLGGTIPSAQAAALVDSRHDQFSAVSLGIGQGPMTVTPLEMANAYAMLARRGSVRLPSFLAGGNKMSAMYPFAPTAVARALDGLHRVVAESYGTGNHMDYGDGTKDPIIEAPGVSIWAKTGTAEAPPLKVDRDHNGVVERTVTDADHAWCGALVGNPGDATPRYAIAVIVEHGGGGGRTAGPVMGAVIRALVSEGYLIGDGSRKVRNEVNAGAVR
ncbi:MAG: hypothetical protein EBY29_15240 [Planctomycetes bacterium]|nr:hypothetical protein [Planctomycetota bacterium]